MRPVLMLLALLCALLVASCTMFDRTAGDGPPLAGTDWMLDAITGADGTQRFGEGATLSFQMDGDLIVRSCNTCRGLWSTYGDTLRAGPLACTRMACPGQLELDLYLTGGSFPITREENVLTIQGQDVNGEAVQLRFHRTVLDPRTGS